MIKNINIKYAKEYFNFNWIKYCLLISECKWNFLYTVESAYNNLKGT